MAAHAYIRESATSFSWADAQRSLLELIFDTVREALDRSEIAFEDIDSVVLSAHDMVDGRSLTSMTTAPAAGAYLKEEIRLGEDGVAALAVADAQIRTGQAHNCIVAAWGRASEGDGQRISNALFDPFFAAPLGITELAVSAMRASKALREYPGYAAHREAAARRRETTPLFQAPAPLRAEEVAPPADVVCAMVVSEAETDVAVRGTGMSSEPYWPGDRDLLELAALRGASATALDRAGRKAADIDHYELDGATLFDEALALEAVGGAGPGTGMAALVTDDRVNASGGYARGACAPAMGLVRTAAALQVLREAGRSAVALASGSSAVAGQVQFAAVLEHA